MAVSEGEICLLEHGADCCCAQRRVQAVRLGGEALHGRTQAGSARREVAGAPFGHQETQQPLWSLFKI